MQGLRMNGENRADFLELLALPGASPVIGVMLPIRLGNAKIKLAFFDLADIVVRTASGRRRTADSMFAALFTAFGCFLVNQTANGVATWK